MKLCIAEKPSVAREIAHILNAKSKKDGYFEGNSYAVTWTFGHFCTLKTPDDYKVEWKKWRLESLPILPEKGARRVVSFNRSSAVPSSDSATSSSATLRS